MRRKQGIILSYVLMIFEVLSTLLVTPFIIRTMGQAEYGVYKLSISITSYLLLLDLGVGNAIIRYIAKFRATKDLVSEKKFFGVAILFYLAVAGASIIGGIILIAVFPHVFSKGLHAEEIVLSQKLLIITLINVAVTMGTTVYANIIIAYERFHISKGLPIVQLVLKMVFTIAVLKLGYGSIGVVFITLLLTVLCRGFYVFYVFCIIKLRPTFKEINSKFIKEILIYSSWVLLQMIATQINASIDSILLGSLVLNATIIIAVYSVGMQIVQYFLSIGQAVGGVLMPGIVKLVESGADSRQLENEMIRIGRFSLTILGMIFVGFLVNGKTFVMVWVGDGYEQAYIVALLLMFAHMLIMTQSIGSQIMWAQNKHQLQAIIKIAVVLANIILTIFLIKWKPLIGATIGTFISLTLGDILSMNIVFRKEIGISLRSYYRSLFKGILPCLLLSAASGYVFSMIPLSGLPGLVLDLSVMILAYMTTMWLFGFNKSEKKMICGMLRKLTNKPKKGCS